MARTVNRGDTYVYRGSILFGNGHLEGKKVTALDNAGEGIFQTSRLEVRCQCCSRTYTVDCAYLH